MSGLWQTLGLGAVIAFIAIIRKNINDRLELIYDKVLEAEKIKVSKREDLFVIMLLMMGVAGSGTSGEDYAIWIGLILTGMIPAYLFIKYFIILKKKSM